MSRTNISHVVTLTHTKDGTAHQLTGDLGNGLLVLVLFEAQAVGQVGDTFYVNGVKYDPLAEDGTDVSETSDNVGMTLFESGRVIRVAIETDTQKVIFKSPGGKGGTTYPEGTYALAKAFRQNGTWTAPFTGTFRFTCFGRGGAGSLCQYNASKSAVSGGGGGSGSWCMKTLKVEKGEVFTAQINITETKLIRGSETIMTAGRGSNGTGGYNGIRGVGGAGGVATGGDENHNGLKGGDGEIEATTRAITTGSATGGPLKGGNGAAAPDWNQLPLYLTGIYGAGGYNSGNSSADGMTPNEIVLFGQTLCSGGGGGGLSEDKATAGKGGSGALGAVLVEVVLGPVPSNGSEDIENPDVPL